VNFSHHIRSFRPHATATSTLPHLKKSPVNLSCRTCNISAEGRYLIHPISDLEVAAGAGCQRCSLALRCIMVMEPEISPQLRYINTQDLIEEFKFFNPGQRPPIKYSVFTHPGAQESSLPFVPVRREIKDRCTTEYLPVLLDWLEDCTTNHDCGNAETPLPMRVLDIGTSPVDNIRLYTTSREHARYIAFSHCWGKAVVSLIRTTVQNIGARTERILDADLPRSYMEVISIARNLNIRYVW
jgi:hypothetical protein